MHPGTNMVATYQGLTWWDNETDGDRMYPVTSRSLSAEQRVEIEKRNPEGSAVKGLWSDPEFLHRTGSPEFNSTLKQTQFADFHGHGWLFRAVFKRDRKGNLIDGTGAPVTDTSSAALAEAVNYTDLRAAADRAPSSAERAAERRGKAVHMKDIHLERGMQCVDCHFKQDNHGNGKLYGEPRVAVEITCADCHGTSSRRAYGNDPAPASWTLRTSGPAAPEGGGTNLLSLNTPFDRPRFQADPRTRRLIQRSMTSEDLSWFVPQVMDTITPGNPQFNEKARLAKTMQRDGKTWGDGASPSLAHADERMACTTCHSSWVTSCFGCHLSQTANQKRDVLHNELKTTRNWTSYNFQVLRDDVFMLGKDSTAMRGRISPVRSSSAVVVSSKDANRQVLYGQQQTVSAEGFAGHSFNTHVPHTVRTTETKTCTDCHVSAEGNNNAVMSQLLLLGTNFVNFIGRFAYVATGHGGVEAVAVTEIDEPQAVIGSTLHKLAYPEKFAAHEARGRRLTTAVQHGSSNALGIQARGEYLLHRRRRGRLQGVRHRADQSEGILGEDRQRPGVAARTAHECGHASRDGGGRAVNARGGSGPFAASGKPGTTDSSALRLHLHHRPRGRPRALDRGDAARWQSGQQHAAAGRGLQPRGPAARCAPPRDRRQLRLRGLRSWTGGRRHQYAVDAAHRLGSRDEQADRGGDSVPLRVCDRRRRLEGGRCHGARTGAGSSTARR